MPLLGETGCRLSEIVGLSLEDIDLENELILIRPNPARRLKTKNSQGTLPLVGYAKLAMEEALRYSDGEYLFPRHIKDGKSEEWRRHFNKIKKELKVCIKGTHRSMFEPKKFHENNAVRFAFFPAAGVGFRLVLPSR